jgi:hypothetical protein
VGQVGLDADRAGHDAVAAYDANRDDELSGEELQACPAILTSLSQYDADGNQRVTADEIATRIEQWQRLKVGMTALACRVTLNGKPLPGATVRFVPEPFVAERLKTASGTTDEGGTAVITIPPHELPEHQRHLSGVFPGLYKVEVSHAAVSLSPYCNTQTTLGQEVAPDNPALSSLLFQLRAGRNELRWPQSR